jgi:hypothetical protein
MKGEFTIPRKTMWQMWVDGRLRFETETLPLTCTDPDCFAPDGDPRAADRWADDGGRA